MMMKLRTTKRLLYCSFVHYTLFSQTSLRKYCRSVNHDSEGSSAINREPTDKGLATRTPNIDYTYHGYLHLFKRSHNLSHLTSIRGICQFLAGRRRAEAKTESLRSASSGGGRPMGEREGIG